MALNKDQRIVNRVSFEEIDRALEKEYWRIDAKSSKQGILTLIKLARRASGDGDESVIAEGHASKGEVWRFLASELDIKRVLEKVKSSVVQWKGLDEEEKKEFCYVALKCGLTTTHTDYMLAQIGNSTYEQIWRREDLDDDKKVKRMFERELGLWQ